MITCSLQGEWSKNGGVIQIPHEVNNEFLFDVSQLSRKGVIPYKTFVGLSDFGKVVIVPEIYMILQYIKRIYRGDNKDSASSKKDLMIGWSLLGVIHLLR